MEDPDARHWGYALSRKASVRSGVLYPMLKRMLEEEWLEDGWEKMAEIDESRPPRRYYRLTPRGLSELGAILDQARSDARFAPVVERLA